jgi:hypothetical protein
MMDSSCRQVARDGAQARPTTVIVPAVEVTQPERMNLLGLLLRGLLERRLLDGARPPLRGDVLVDAGGMRVTLRFAETSVEITRDPPAGRPIARITGTLRAFLELAVGRGWLRSLLARRIRPRGNPVTLLRLLRLFSAKGTAK